MSMSGGTSRPLASGTASTLWHAGRTCPRPKPEPDLYRLVLNQFGLRGHEAIAFEDSHTGTLAAKRAGLWVVAVPNASTSHHDFGHVDLEVGSLADCRLGELQARFGR